MPNNVQIQTKLNPLSIEFIKSKVYQVYQAQFKSIIQISIPEKRDLYCKFRDLSKISVNSFIPAQGITVGEFMFFTLDKLAKTVKKDKPDSTTATATKKPAKKKQKSDA